jgi:protein TonB
MKTDDITPAERERLEHLMISAVYDDISDDERRELDVLVRRFPPAVDDFIALQDLRCFITKPDTALQASEAFYSKQLSVLEAALKERKISVPPRTAARKVAEQPVILQPNKPLIRASDLKRIIPLATQRGFVAALVFFGTLLGTYSAFLTLRSTISTVSPINKMKLTNLPPPPQQTEAAPPPPPTAPGPAARAGTPVPVPDALIAPDVKDFANVDEISRASTTGGDGNDQGFLGLASDVDTEVREDEPNAYDFVPVEKEPYIDIKELQRKVIYPDLAKRAGIEGKVNIRVLVGKNGVPKKHIVESTDSDLLNDAAIKAVMNSVFTPAIQNNQPIDCWVSIPIIFRLR